MSPYRKIQSELSGAGDSVRIKLNAPPTNILDIEMIGELTAALTQHSDNDGLKAILFDHTGDHFSYGASIPQHVKPQVDELLPAFHNFFQTLIKGGWPTIAIVRGRCLGGGLELAGFCNWIFSAPDAEFGQPEIKLACFPPVASLILPHRIGQSAADDLILSGRSITAQKAHELGLVHEITQDPDAAAERFLDEHIRPKSGVALRHTARAVRKEMHTAFLTHISELEKTYLQEVAQTYDANEGVEAFIAKRAPKWRNR